MGLLPGPCGVRFSTSSSSLASVHTQAHSRLAWPLPSHSPHCLRDEAPELPSLGAEALGTNQTRCLASTAVFSPPAVSPAMFNLWPFLWAV